MKKNLLLLSLISLILIPIFGFNFLMNLIGNILILIFLIPVLILLIVFLSFNSLKSKVAICNQCGNIMLGLDNTCKICGADLGEINSKNFDNFKKPSETTIEIKAEEIN